MIENEPNGPCTADRCTFGAARALCEAAVHGARGCCPGGVSQAARQSRGPDDAVAWLYRVVRNGAIDAAKLARRRLRRETAAARPVRWFIEPEVDGLDAATAIAALERLSSEEREVIVARHWGGLTFEQIATVVGCSASTAFRRYSVRCRSVARATGGFMSGSFLERLSRFTPDAGGLNRDELLYAAGRSSARPNRVWMTVASLLAATQALSLVLLLPPARPCSRA